MKNTVRVGKFDVRLDAKFGEYNCFSKTCGRLELVVTEDGGKTNLGAAKVQDKLTDKVRDQIISNFLKDLDDGSNFAALNEGGAKQYFPSDTGHYRPGILMYVDRVHMGKEITWFNNWKGLIELFEKEPKFKVEVIKTPLVGSRFYGAGTPSRVWVLYLPSVSETSATNGIEKLKEGLKNELTYGASEHLNKEIKKLGVKAA